MVARLVEQHHVGAHQEDAGERDAHLPAAGEHADVALHHRLAEAEAGEDLLRPSLQRVAVEFLEASLHLAVSLDDRVHLVGAFGVGERALQRLQFGRDRADRPRAVHHLCENAAARHLADILAEIADGDSAIGRDLTLVGRLLAGDHAKQRCLAGAVRPDEPGLLAFLERGGRLDEEDLLAVLLADLVEAYHGARDRGTSPRPRP